MSHQLIKHGATIETATPAEVAALVTKATENQYVSHYRREKQATQLDATGAGQIKIPTTRQYDWVYERVTVAAGANGQVTFYENQIQDSDLLENIVLDARGRYSDAFSNKMVVPAGSTLLVVFAVAGANASASVNLQAQLLRVAA